MSNNQVLPNELMIMIAENVLLNIDNLDELVKLRIVHSTFNNVFEKYILTCKYIFQTIDEKEKLKDYDISTIIFFTNSKPSKKLMINTLGNYTRIYTRLELIPLSNLLNTYLINQYNKKSDIKLDIKPVVMSNDKSGRVIKTKNTSIFLH